MTAREMAAAAEMIKDRLYFVACRNPPKQAAQQSKKMHFFSIDKTLVYWNFFLDFGPLSLCQTYRFCQLLNFKLSDPALKDHKLVFYCSHHPHRRTNAALLVAAYSLLYLGKTVDEAYAPLKGMAAGFADFHDASPIACTFKVAVYDCLLGMDTARKANLFDFDNFPVDEYEHYEKVENGDLNWIMHPSGPSSCMAFAGPQKSREAGLLDGYSTLTPEHYYEYFERRALRNVIRLNKRYYDKQRFEKVGIKVHELYFRDGSVPTLEQVQRFNHIMERVLQPGVQHQEPISVAVHCKAGLGRTGTMIGCYLMKHYGFVASAAIGWIRVCRPGSIIGPQQHFLAEMQPLMHREGETYRRRLGGNSVSISPVDPGMQLPGSVPSADDKTLGEAFGRLGVEGMGVGGDSEWVEALDKATNKTYWYNKRTRASQWTRPMVKSNGTQGSSARSFQRVNSQGDELRKAKAKSPKATKDKKGLSAFFRSR